MRVLLLIPHSSYRAAAYLRAAAELELDLIVASDHRPALPSESLIELPLHQPAQAARVIETIHARTPIDGVLATDERTALVAAVGKTIAANWVSSLFA